VGGRNEAPIRVFIGQRSSAPVDGFTLVSPPPRPGLLSRLLGRFRGRR
jgi:hypothetical protein